MKERPILMSGAMVRATLREVQPKTQTRRVVKLPHNNPLGQWEPIVIGDPNGGRTARGETIPEEGGIWHTRTGDCLACPYGGPGDRLYVRETWNTSARCLPPINEPYIYAADLNEMGVMKWAATWKPSIHMPRGASRILLEITGVRVERLQDISEDDAIAEGVDGPMCAAAVGRAPSRATLLPAAVHGYAHLWESLNGARGYGWDANPWVWVIEFKRVAELNA